MECHGIFTIRRYNFSDFFQVSDSIKERNERVPNVPQDRREE